jgi:hypothetical protein
MALTNYQETLLFMACRYAIGRKSIASCVLPDDIVNNDVPNMSDVQKEKLSEDIKREVNYNIHYKLKTGDHTSNEYLYPWSKLGSYLDLKNRFKITDKKGNKYICFYDKLVYRYYPVDRYEKDPHMEIYVDETLIDSIEQL